MPYRIEDIIPRAELAGEYGLGKHGRRKENCIASTIAFTHGDLIKKVYFRKTIDYQALEKIARDLAKKSRSRVTFAEYDSIKPPTSKLLVSELDSCQAFWISVSVRDDQMCHLYGALRKNTDDFFFWDTKGELSPVRPVSLSHLSRHLLKKLNGGDYYYGEIFAFNSV